MPENELKDKQYGGDGKYKARILIHSKYGTNKCPWPIWLFNQYHFGVHAEIIEFGCGNGLLWKVNSFRINSGWQILLTDFSQGMIDAARSYIGPDLQNIRYQVVDLSDYHVNPEKFTHILANHMLYHIDNRKNAIQTIYDMLESGGEFYASTVGMDNMREMKNLVESYTGNDNYSKMQGSIASCFSLENGAAQLADVFSNVERIEYPDALEITDACDLADYVISCNDLSSGIQVLPEDQRDGFIQYISRLMEKEGKIPITKSSGTFIASK